MEHTRSLPGLPGPRNCYVGPHGTLEAEGPSLPLGSMGVEGGEGSVETMGVEEVEREPSSLRACTPSWTLF
jgi:hypothetical protein